MADPARKVATYDDVLAAPPNTVAELIHGALHVQPRPATRHARAASSLGGLLGPPFEWGDAGGPGGWILLDEPELHLGAHVLVPNLGGWRRERMPEIPDAAFLTVAPNWVCEVLSPSTSGIDRGEKMPIYAAHGVEHAWLVDPAARTLEVFAREGTRWVLLEVHRGDARVRAAPFDAVELLLERLWAS